MHPTARAACGARSYPTIDHDTTTDEPQPHVCAAYAGHTLRAHKCSCGVVFIDTVTARPETELESCSRELIAAHRDRRFLDPFVNDLASALRMQREGR